MKWDSGPGVWMSDFAPRDREVVDGNPIPCTTGGNDESRFSFSSSFSYHSHSTHFEIPFLETTESLPIELP